MDSRNTPVRENSAIVLPDNDIGVEGMKSLGESLPRTRIRVLNLGREFLLSNPA